MWNKKSITMINAHERNKELQTVYMAKMMDLIGLGKFRAREMVTHEFRPDEIDKAFAALENKPAGYIKGYVDFRG
jgi:threonine dehydrogenase-like Zn-dependent dehydrogenase